MVEPWVQDAQTLTAVGEEGRGGGEEGGRGGGGEEGRRGGGEEGGEEGGGGGESEEDAYVPTHDVQYYPVASRGKVYTE